MAAPNPPAPAASRVNWNTNSPAPTIKAPMPVRISAPRRITKAGSKAANGQGRRCQSSHPAPGHQRGKCRGICGEAADVVEEGIDRHANRPRAARHVGQRVGHRFQRWSHGRRQPVGEAQPDQAELGDCVAGALDLCCVGWH